MPRGHQEHENRPASKVLRKARWRATSVARGRDSGILTPQWRRSTTSPRTSASSKRGRSWALRSISWFFWVEMPDCDAAKSRRWSGPISTCRNGDSSSSGPSGKAGGGGNRRRPRPTRARRAAGAVPNASARRPTSMTAAASRGGNRTRNQPEQCTWVARLSSGFGA
jgi:hypothetical protein